MAGWVQPSKNVALAQVWKDSRSNKRRAGLSKGRRQETIKHARSVHGPEGLDALLHGWTSSVNAKKTCSGKANVRIVWSLSTLDVEERWKGAHAAPGVPRASAGCGETLVRPNSKDSAGRRGEGRECLNLLRLVRDAAMTLGGPCRWVPTRRFPVQTGARDQIG